MKGPRQQEQIKQVTRVDRCVKLINNQETTWDRQSTGEHMVQGNTQKTMGSHKTAKALFTLHDFKTSG